MGELVAAWECDIPGPDAPRLRAAVERKIAKLDAKIAEMTSFRRDLLVARQALGEDPGDADRATGAGDPDGVTD